MSKQSLIGPGLEALLFDLSLMMLWYYSPMSRELAREMSSIEYRKKGILSAKLHRPMDCGFFADIATGRTYRCEQSRPSLSLPPFLPSAIIRDDAQGHVLSAERNGMSKRTSGFSRTNRKLKQMIFPTWLIALAIMTAACGRSTPPDTTEAPPQLSATPVSTVVYPPPAEASQSKFLRFDRLTAEDGLPNDQVWDVVQDNDGFMWFATVDGLSRYNGNSFTVFRHDVSDSSSLSQSYTLDLLLDQNGVLWVGTWDSGLNQYNP